MKRLKLSFPSFYAGTGYNRKFNDEVAIIFKNAITKDFGKQSQLNVRNCFEGNNFVPRIIPLEELLNNPNAPWNCWTKYEILKRPSNVKSLHLGQSQLSKSFTFLLKVCSNLVDIQMIELYHSVQYAEKVLLSIDQNIKNIVT